MAAAASGIVQKIAMLGYDHVYRFACYWFRPGIVPFERLFPLFYKEFAIGFSIKASSNLA